MKKHGYILALLFATAVAQTGFAAGISSGGSPWLPTIDPGNQHDPFEHNPPDNPVVNDQIYDVYDHRTKQQTKYRAENIPPAPPILVKFTPKPKDF